MFVFWRQAHLQRGATLPGYALILMFVAIGAMGSLAMLGSSVDQNMGNLSSSMQSVEAASTFLEDDFSGEGGLLWQQIWGKWKIDKHGRFKSKKKWAKAVTFLDGNDYQFSLDLQTLSKKYKHMWDVSRVVFRFQDPKNYYALVPKRDGTLELAKMQDGVWHPWLNHAYTGANPNKSHNYQVRIVGNHISVWQDGLRLIDYTDPNPVPSGGIGVTNSNSRGRFDNVKIQVYDPSFLPDVD